MEAVLDSRYNASTFYVNRKGATCRLQSGHAVSGDRECHAPGQRRGRYPVVREQRAGPGDSALT
jgi:hypothetical protein